MQPGVPAAVWYSPTMRAAVCVIKPGLVSPSGPQHSSHVSALCWVLRWACMNRMNMLVVCGRLHYTQQALDVGHSVMSRSECCFWSLALCVVCSHLWYQGANMSWLLRACLLWCMVSGGHTRKCCCCWWTTVDQSGTVHVGGGGWHVMRMRSTYIISCMVTQKEAGTLRSVGPRWSGQGGCDHIQVVKFCDGLVQLHVYIQGLCRLAACVGGHIQVVCLMLCC